MFVEYMITMIGGSALICAFDYFTGAIGIIV
jgi:hypothetical protein